MTATFEEKMKNAFQERKPTSVFPMLNYLSTGYLIGFFVSLFFSTFLITPQFEGAGNFTWSLWSAEKAIALGVIFVVVLGAVWDWVGKRISKEQGMITVLVSIIFFLLVQYSYLLFNALRIF